MKFKRFYSIFWDNTALWLLPFLIFYIIVCIAFSQDELVADEGTYLLFANNLLNGFYSPPAPDIHLWSGPGYPLLLSPFVLVKLPPIALRLINALLLYSSLVISYKSFIEYSSRKTSLIFTIFLGLYFPIYNSLIIIMTETLAWFLISLICYLFIKNFKQKPISWKYIILSSLTIAYLAMTKIIFGYVILAALFASIFFFLMPGFFSSARKFSLIVFISFIFCLPYLIYTYSLTNKVFYWSNAGSLSLYTMSTPYENELGEWNHEETLLVNPNHTVFIDSIRQLNALEKDEAYKKQAIDNITNNPKKFFVNWIANIGRLMFSYPKANEKQTIATYFWIIPNMFVIVFISLASLIAIRRYQQIPEELIYILIFILIYLIGSSMLSGYSRMFYITIPFWFLFIVFVYSNMISVTFTKRVN